LLESFWGGSVFLLAVPVMVLLLVVGPRLLPEFRDPEPGRFDLAGAALSLVSVLAVIYGIKRMAEEGFGSQAALAMAAGLVVGVSFVYRQGGSSDPMIDLRLFRVPAFSASLAANALALFAVFGIELFIAHYLQLVLGMGPFEAGLWTLPSAAGFIVGSMLAPLIARAVRLASLVAGGLAVTALGLAMLTQVGADSGLALLVAGSVVMALGAAQVVTLSTDLIVGAASPERAGTASGISETGTELGGALGIAILGSLGTAVYRSEVSDAVPAGVPSHAAEAVKDTLGGATHVADRIPAGLIDAATVAFTHGLQVAAATSAVLMLGLAALAAVLLRDARTDGRPEPDPRGPPAGGRTPLRAWPAEQRAVAYPNTQRVGEPVKSSWAMPNAQAGRTRIVALTPGSRNSTVMPASYLAFMRSTKRATASNWVTSAALPSSTTGSAASSVVTTQRASAARLRALRDRRLLLNQSAARSHTPHTGITCGLPSGHRVVTQ
jgi:MFS transporter, DHA2 family, multidrug resistance protein